MNHKTKVVGGRVLNEVAERMEEIAQEEGVSRSEIIERALIAYSEIRLLCVWSDISIEECCSQISDLFRDGRIVIREGKLEVDE